MENFIFQNPVKLIMGKGMIARLAKEIPSDKRIMITFGGCVRLCGILFGKRTQSRTKTCQSDFDVGGDKVVGGKAE